jgi:putative cell wall-binding protein
LLTQAKLRFLKVTCCLMILTLLLSSVRLFTPQLVRADPNNVSDPATELTIKYGKKDLSNPTTEYTELVTFSDSEMTDMATTQQMYSYFDNLPAPVISAATGVPLATLLAQAGINLNKVERLYFYTTDSGGKPFRIFSKEALYDDDRYYFPNIGNSWNEGTKKPDKSGEWGSPTDNKVPVQPLIAVMDDWRRVLEDGEPDFDTASDASRFRLLYGQTESDYLGAVSTAMNSAKWIFEIDVKLSANAEDPVPPGEGGSNSGSGGDDGGSGNDSSNDSSTGDTGTDNQPATLNPGGDNTAYNQKALAALKKVTYKQNAGVDFLPEGSMVPSSLTGWQTLTAKDGVQLNFSPGSVKSLPGVIRMKTEIGKVTAPPVIETTAVVLNPLKYQRQFTVEGYTDGTVRLDAPVTISFPVKVDSLPSGIRTDQLAIYWWNPEAADWIKIGGAFNPQTSMISAPVLHFSTYAVMADTAAYVNRLWGESRFDTAIAIARQGWGTGAEHVVLANAYSFPDALAAGPLAYKYNAPILLTDPDTLTPETLSEIKNLNPKSIIVIGGTGAVSQSIEDSLRATYGRENVVRYGGTDRYETAAAIAAALGTNGRAVIANGEEGHYADALAVSSYAANQEIPILFATTSGLPEPTAKALADRAVKENVVVGGEDAVPAAVFNNLRGAVRYGGTDRYATATAIAEGLKLNLNQVYVVTGLNFPDALVAGNYAARTQSPLLMVDKGLPEATRSFLNNNKGIIAKISKIGGEDAISPSQEEAIRNALQ